MNSRPEARAVSAATKAPGMMLVPGWVSMRKVSHLPPAIRHLRVGERGAALRHPGAVHHDGGAGAHTGLFFGDELHGLGAVR